MNINGSSGTRTVFENKSRSNISSNHNYTIRLTIESVFNELYSKTKPLRLPNFESIWGNNFSTIFPHIKTSSQMMRCSSFVFLPSFQMTFFFGGLFFALPTLLVSLDSIDYAVLGHDNTSPAKTFNSTENAAKRILKPAWIIYQFGKGQWKSQNYHIPSWMFFCFSFSCPSWCISVLGETR